MVIYYYSLDTVEVFLTKHPILLNLVKVNEEVDLIKHHFLTSNVKNKIEMINGDVILNKNIQVITIHVVYVVEVHPLQIFDIEDPIV